jgi:hypothetical protein
MSSSSVKVVVAFIAGFALGKLTDMNGATESRNSNLQKNFQKNTSSAQQQTPLLPEADLTLTFAQLVRASGSDKYVKHHYEHYYEDWLAPYRYKDTSFLEIGVKGGKSMQLWKSYFANPTKIIGLGYGIKEKVANAYKTGIPQVVVGDQSKTEVMEIMKSLGPYDVVIDDGSHVPEHVIFTFFHLWQSVKPGGMYVVEDLETSYWEHETESYGYKLQNTGFGGSGSAVEKLKDFIDILPRYQLNLRDFSIMEGDENICSIEWGMNLVRFRKCTLHEMEMRPIYKESSNPKERTSLTHKDWLMEARTSNPIV